MATTTKTKAPEAPTVHEAWADVMAGVRELAKGDRNDFHGFNFRGIDAVMNATGPVLREHRVAVVPTDVQVSHRDVQTSKGKPSRECTVVATFTVYGPAGDSFTGVAPGEAMDDGDKGTPKAMSVALRTFLLQSLCLPTQDTDPDAQSYERAGGPTDQELAQQAADAITAATDADDVRTWGNRAHGKGLLDLPVNVPGGSMPLRQLVRTRITELAPPDDADTTDQAPADDADAA